MAVIYSKLGGCLGETKKLGPLSRTDLWAGVKGLLDRLMMHLGLGSSLEDPWGSLLGMVGVGLSSQEIALFSWEAWTALCLAECLKPCLPDLPWLLDWPAWELPLPFPREGWVVAWEDLLPSLGGRWAVAGGELLPSLGGRWAIAWEELLPSLWGRRAPAWLSAWDKLLLSPGGSWAVAGGELLSSPGGRWATAWELLLPSLGRRWAVAWEELLPSLEGRRMPACLPACLPEISCFLPQREGGQLSDCLLEIDCFLLWGEGEC